MERTNAEIYDAVLDVKEKVISLKEHVNDRNETIERNMKQLSDRIDNKVDKRDLLTLLGFRLMENRAVRWAAGVIAFTALASLVSQRWYPWLQAVTEALKHI